jgi:hypothetical protein
VNKHRLARILVAVLALLTGSGPAWSACLWTGAEAMAASHAVPAVPAHCEEPAVHHPDCTHAGPLCLADHPAFAGAALPGKSPAGAEQPTPDALPPALPPWVAVSTAPIGPPIRVSGVPPRIPTTLVQLRMLLLD